MAAHSRDNLQYVRTGAVQLHSPRFCFGSKAKFIEHTVVLAALCYIALVDTIHYGIDGKFLVCLGKATTGRSLIIEGFKCTGAGRYVTAEQNNIELSIHGVVLRPIGNEIQCHVGRSKAYVGVCGSIQTKIRY